MHKEGIFFAWNAKDNCTTIGLNENNNWNIRYKKNVNINWIVHNYLIWIMLLTIVYKICNALTN